MSFLWQKRLDNYLGRPILAMVAAGCRLQASFRRASPSPSLPPEPRRIVVTKYLGLGSLVHLEPSLRFLKRRYPTAELIVITSAGTANFVKILDCADRVLAVELKPMFPLLRSLAQVFLHFWRRPADLLFDAESLTCFSALVAASVRCQYRIGFRDAQGGCRRHVFTKTVALQPALHMADQFLALVGGDAALAFKETRGRPREPSNFVGVNLNASDMASERRWPLEHFADYLTYFAEAYPDVIFILTGLASERRYSEALLTRLPENIRQRCNDQTGQTSLAQLVQLIASLRLMISVDSGPLAIAAYLGVPTLSFWGPETPQRYGPRSPVPTEHRTLSIRVHCSPCLTDANYKTPPCGGRNICMQQMTAAWAWQESQDFLAELWGKIHKLA